MPQAFCFLDISFCALNKQAFDASVQLLMQFLSQNSIKLRNGELFEYHYNSVLESMFCWYLTCLSSVNENEKNSDQRPFFQEPLSRVMHMILDWAILVVYLVLLLHQGILCRIKPHLVTT